MQVMMNIVLLLQMAAAVAMIGLVLVQQGKGADMGASFGGGASGSLFGATGSANFLSRSTAIAASVFFLCTLALAYFGNLRPQDSGSSILDRAAAPVAASAPASAAPAAAQIPGLVAPAASAPASR
ncbi:MAG: preprotein translocase subunit SecG [Pseudomonadota bacterium]|jgi:preprotein translocase subunit SecG